MACFPSTGTAHKPKYEYIHMQTFWIWPCAYRRITHPLQRGAHACVVPWTGEELEYKPPRRLFEHTVSVGPREVKLRRPIDEEAFRAIPGRDPNGELHGEGRYNPYQQCLDYCKQDVSSLMIIWERWREGVHAGA